MGRTLRQIKDTIREARARGQAKRGDALLAIRTNPERKKAQEFSLMSAAKRREGLRKLPKAERDGIKKSLKDLYPFGRKPSLFRLRHYDPVRVRRALELLYTSASPDDKVLAGRLVEYFVTVANAGSAAQSRAAKNPRAKLSHDGITIEKVYSNLASMRDELGDPLPATELWPLLYSDLDSRGLNPVSDPNSKKAAYKYDGGKDNGARKQITFGAFANAISKHRKNTKSY